MLGDPISAGVGLAGAGLMAYGAYQQYQGAQANEAAITKYGALITAQKTTEIGLEQKLEGFRRQAMEIDVRRKSLENLRNAQRARALSTATTTAQGANRGSGVGGAMGQIAGEEGTNALGISQSWQLGKSAFDTNALISESRIAQANLGYQQSVAQAAGQSQMALGQGISAVGGALVGSMGPARGLGGFLGK